MRKLRFFAQADGQGFPVPGTLQGYPLNAIPCTGNHVEITSEVYEPTVNDKRIYHCSKLRFFYQIDSRCCVLPNSLISSSKHPGRRFIEFKLYDIGEIPEPIEPEEPEIPEEPEPDPETDPEP